MTVKVIIVSANEVNTCENFITAIKYMNTNLDASNIHTQDFKCNIKIKL